MNKPVYIVTNLWVREGSLPAFEEYERKAVHIMKRYGGSVDRVIRFPAHDNIGEYPFETHLVQFSTREMFEAFRSDADYLGLAMERETVISKTVVLIGYECPPYAT